MKRTLICSTVLAMMPAVALAQSNEEETTAADSTQTQQQDGQTHVTALSEWVYDDLYSSGWTVEALFNRTAVMDKSGEEIGDVENVLIGEDGQILSLIVEVGGFWDIGDTHVSVPWDEVTLGSDMSEITVPVNEENLDEYSVFADDGYFFASEADKTQPVDDDLQTGERVFKATELIGDYAYLTGSEEYGYVSDLVFNEEEGKLQAVLIDGAASGMAGTYAYPFYGYDYDWHPSLTYYALPYDSEEITIIDTFDYAELDSMPEDWNQDETTTGSVGQDDETGTTDETDTMDE